jgi:hypothetical protein
MTVPWMTALGVPGDVQASILRDIVPAPFRPVTIKAGWLLWEGGTIRNMARTVYEEQAFDRLPILADALEEAGCADPALLGHCRQPGEHVRGCWVVDAVLGKA